MEPFLVGIVQNQKSFIFENRLLTGLLERSAISLISPVLGPHGSLLKGANIMIHPRISALFLHNNAQFSIYIYEEMGPIYGSTRCMVLLVFVPLILVLFLRRQRDRSKEKKGIENMLRMGNEE